MEAISLAEEVGDCQLLKMCYADIGHIHVALGNYYSALELLHKSLEIDAGALDLAIQISDKSAEGTIRSNMAMLELEEGNIDNARFQAEAALEIYGKIYSTVGQADALYLLGSIEDLFNDATFAAYQQYKEAISLSETLRENLLLDDFKISFAENHVALYQQMISLCIRMGKTEEAFEYIERSKSRAFVDMLSSSSNTIGAKELTSKQIEEIANLRGKLDLLRRQIASSYLDANENESDVRREDLVTEISDLEEILYPLPLGEVFDYELSSQCPFRLILIASTLNHKDTLTKSACNGSA